MVMVMVKVMVMVMVMVMVRAMVMDMDGLVAMVMRMIMMVMVLEILFMIQQSIIDSGMVNMEDWEGLNHQMKLLLGNVGEYCQKVIYLRYCDFVVKLR